MKKEETKVEWTEPVIEPEFIVEKEGRKIVLIGGLIKEAKKQGFIRFAPTLNNILEDGTVIFKSEVNFANFSAIGWGSARREDMTDAFKPHYIAVAETKANSRALKLALGVTMLVDGEIAGQDSIAVKKASDSQINYAKKLVDGDFKEYIKVNYNLNDAKDLTGIQASEIITKFK